MAKDKELKYKKYVGERGSREQWLSDAMKVFGLENLSQKDIMDASVNAAPVTPDQDVLPKKKEKTKEKISEEKNRKVKWRS